MKLPFTTPLEAVQCYCQAVATKTESAAQAASTKQGFTPGPATGPGFYFHNFARLGMGLTPLAVETHDDVAVVPAETQRPGYPMAKVYFLLERSIGNWRIAGISKSAAYGKKFLAGEAPALFDITQLPPEPEVVPWAEELLARYDGDEGAAADVPGVDELVTHWRAFVAAEPGDTYIKRTLKVALFERAAIQFAHELKTASERDPTGPPTKREEKMWMVAARTASSWEPVWFGHDFEPEKLFTRLD